MQTEETTTYRLSQAGRRTTLLLMLGATLLWLTAGWMLINLLNVAWFTPNAQSPCSVSPLLRATFSGQAVATVGGQCAPLTVTQAVPAVLLLILLVALPLMFWNLCEEWATSYTITDQGLIYHTLGRITITYPWNTIHGIRRVDPQSDDPVDELIVDETQLRQVRPAVLRWFHRVAFGRSRVPIYEGVEHREALLALIRERSNLRPAAVGQGIETARRSL